MHLKDFENSPSSFIGQSNVIYGSTSSSAFISSCCFSRNKRWNMLRQKNDKEKIFPEGRRINTLRNSNISIEHHISDSKIAIFD